VRAVVIAAGAILLLVMSVRGQEPRIEQVESFATIRSITLDRPLPSTDAKAFSALAEDLRIYRRDSQGPPPRACCTLRTDLSGPNRVALSCRDLTGKYIGTVAARKLRDVQQKLEDYGLFGSKVSATAAPGTLPLHQYRYVVVNYRTETALYVIDLLTRDGFWRLFTSEDKIPATEVDRALRLRPLGGGSGGSLIDPWESLRGSAVLYLSDNLGRTVREIHGTTELRGGQGAVRAAVHRLIQARRLDEEVHRPLTADSLRSPSVPTSQEFQAARLLRKSRGPHPMARSLAMSLVAIKVLPPDISGDPERRARFEREAKTIAGLLTVEQTAEVLQVSPETVMRDWKVAKLRLLAALKGREVP
jgi:hypothetical protein